MVGDLRNKNKNKNIQKNNSSEQVYIGMGIQFPGLYFRSLTVPYHKVLKTAMLK